MEVDGGAYDIALIQLKTNKSNRENPEKGDERNYFALEL